MCISSSTKTLLCLLCLEFALEKHTGIPWQAGLKRGSALEEEQDVIVVKEEGYYFIYSQVEHYDPPTVTELTVLIAKRQKIAFSMGSGTGMSSAMRELFTFCCRYTVHFHYTRNTGTPAHSSSYPVNQSCASSTMHLIMHIQVKSFS